MNEKIFTLRDFESGESMTVLAEECGSFLNLTPEGYGQVVSLDFYEGKLRVHINTSEYPDEPMSITLNKEIDNEILEKEAEAAPAE